MISMMYPLSVISLEISIGELLLKVGVAKLNTRVNGPDGDLKCQIWTKGENQYFYLNCALFSSPAV